MRELVHEMDRRRVRLGAVLLCLLAGCGRSTPPPDTQPSDFHHAPAVVASAAPRSEGTPGNGQPDPALAPLDAATTRTVRLDVVPHDIEIAPGVRYSAKTYGGQVPGPVVHARQGDLVQVTLTNRCPPEPASRAAYGLQSVSFHGAMIASPDRFRSVAPGESLSFEFRLNYPGVFMYHSATPMVAERVADGQFGALVVEPRQGWATHADREYVVVQSELYARLAGKGADVYSLDPVTVRTGQVSYSVFNGRLYELVSHPLKARAGERVRLYLLNAGPNHGSSLQIEGVVFDRVYVGGNPDSLLRGQQAVALSPGASAVVEFIVPEEGRYIFLDHTLNMAAEGATGMIDASTSSEARPPGGSPPHAPFESSDSHVQMGYKLFSGRCAVCHSLRAGIRVGWEGPDLDGVTRRHSADWLRRWLESPDAMLASDPEAKALLVRYRYPMPPQNLSRDDIQDLLAYLRYVDRSTPQGSGVP